MNEMSTKFQLTADNYYSDEANRIYLSVSQFKDFVGTYGRMGCEEMALAKIRGDYKTEPSNPMMIGSYVDLYRVKLGAARKKNYSTVFKDFGYKGSDYRLKRSAETASHYTLGQIEACLQVLLELDQSLKSQPVEEQILLETALCRLAMAGSGR